MLTIEPSRSLLQTGQVVEEDDDDDEEDEGEDEEASAEAFMQEQMAKLDEEKSAILNNQSLIAEVGQPLPLLLLRPNCCNVPHLVYFCVPFFVEVVHLFFWR